MSLENPFITSHALFRPNHLSSFSPHSTSRSTPYSTPQSQHVQHNDTNLAQSQLQPSCKRHWSSSCFAKMRSCDVVFEHWTTPSTIPSIACELNLLPTSSDLQIFIPFLLFHSFITSVYCQRIQYQKLLELLDIFVVFCLYNHASPNKQSRA